MLRKVHRNIHTVMMSCFISTHIHSNSQPIAYGVPLNVTGAGGRLSLVLSLTLKALFTSWGLFLSVHSFSQPRGKEKSCTGWEQRELAWTATLKETCSMSPWIMFRTVKQSPIYSESPCQGYFSLALLACLLVLEVNGDNSADLGKKVKLTTASCRHVLVSLQNFYSDFTQQNSSSSPIQAGEMSLVRVAGWLKFISSH